MAKHRTGPNYVIVRREQVLHPCNWDGCAAMVDEAKWACDCHYFAIPLKLRRQLWAAWQRIRDRKRTKKDFVAYRQILGSARVWIAEHGHTLLGEGSDGDGGECERQRIRAAENFRRRQAKRSVAYLDQYASSHE